MRMIGQVALGVFVGMVMFSMAAALFFSVVQDHSRIDALASEAR